MVFKKTFEIGGKEYFLLRDNHDGTGVFLEMDRPFETIKRPLKPQKEIIEFERLTRIS